MPGNEARTLYQRRLAKESIISEEKILARMRWDMPILSYNSKCGISLDLPFTNCLPTKICAEFCYAAQGRQNYKKAVIKSLAVNRLIIKDPEHVARKMVDEAAGRTIRIAGSGEIIPEHKALLEHVENYGGKWWGFTKRVDTHQALPELMFSLDATTPKATLEYVQDYVPVSRRAYLIQSEETKPPLEVAVTFPIHGPWTNKVPLTELLATDCPAARKEVSGCWQCERCY